MGVVIVRENSAKIFNTMRGALVISGVKEKGVTQETHDRKIDTSYIITNISSGELINYMPDLLAEPT